MATFVVSIIVFAASILAFYAFMGLWVYHDAKEKSDHPAWLWIIVVLFINNFVGLILYLIIGRNKKDVVASGRFKKLAIASAIGLALGTAFFTVETVRFSTSANAQHRQIGSFAAVEDTLRNGVWQVSAQRASGSISLSPQLTYEELQQFYVRGSIGSGRVTLQVGQGNNYFIVDITNTAQRVDLSGLQPGRVSLELLFENAENVSVNTSWR
ncbi:MAG: PLD nuclease N-terminal domain-containing protein [Defluviitaleaceae bacterium]|nr:PLD nuclease N-terminal domain-containing protein [Defluviitaleaceae bacterium]